MARRSQAQAVQWEPCRICGSTAGHCPDYPRYASGWWARVQLARQCLITGRGTSSRAFDNCFEMYDGDAVVSALYRLAQREPQLQAGIDRLWDNEQARASLAKIVQSLEHVKFDKLEGVARKMRERGPAAWSGQLDLI